jgi:WD40 repeat protein
VPIYDIGEHEGQHYFSMKFVEGGDLLAWLRARQASEAADKSGSTSRSSVAAAVQMLTTVARAVHHAHQRGILHRDLKPANILIDAQGQPNVTDFGLGKRIDTGAGATQTGTVLGTPAYMSPEQASGKKGLTTATDVYSLGAILYECLTSVPPFRAATPMDTLLQVLESEPARPRSLNPRTDGDLETICLKCLDKRPERRYGSAEALAEDLEHWSKGEPITARPVGRAERLWRWCQRDPIVATLAAAVLVVAMVGFAGVLWQWRAAVANEQKAIESAEDAKKKEQQAKDERDIADQQREEVRKANLQLKAAQEELRSTLYFSQMQAAQEALEANDIPRVLELLDLQRPGKGETDLRGFEWDLLRRACYTARLSIVAHPVAPDSPFLLMPALNGARLCYSPDGKHVASAWPNAIRIHDGETGKEVLTISRRLEPGGVLGAAFQSGLLAYSPKGSFLAAATPLGQQGGAGLSLAPAVKLFDVRDGRELRSFASSMVFAMGVAADGKHVVTLSRPLLDVFGKANFQIDWWDVDTGKSVKQVKPANLKSDGLIPALTNPSFHFSGDGKRLAAQGDKHLHLIDPETGEDIRTFPIQKSTAVALNSDGTFLAVVSADQVLTVWDAVDGSQLCRRPLRGQSIIPESQFGAAHSFIRFTADGKQLAIGAEQSVRLLDARSGGEQGVFRGHRSGLSGIAFRPDGQRIAAVTQDGRLKVWDTQTADSVSTVAAKPSFDLRLSQNGMVQAGLCSPAVKAPLEREVWVRTMSPLEKPFTIKRAAHTTGLRWSLGLSPDGNQLAIVAGDAKDRQIEIWHVPTRKLRLTLPAPGSPASFVVLAFSDDGDRLAVTVNGSDELKVWDLGTSKELIFEKGKGAQQLVAISRDGRFLVGASSPEAGKASKVRLWDIDQRIVAATLEAKATHCCSASARMPNGSPWSGPRSPSTMPSAGIWKFGTCSQPLAVGS